MHFSLKILTLVFLFIFISFKTNAQELNPNLLSYNNHLTLRAGFLNNSITSYITGDNSSVIPIFQQLGTVEIGSNYWFGLINQEELYKLGFLFGVGFYLTYGKFYFIDNDPSLQQPQGIDSAIYILNLEFLKIPLLMDNNMKNYLVLTSNYVSYSNNLMPFSTDYTKPFSGVGIGLSGNYNLDKFGALLAKILFLPYISSYPLKNIYGLNSEIGYRYFILPTTAFNISYKFNYYTANTDIVAKLDSNNSQKVSNFHVNIYDIIHIISIGTEYYF